jgi:hypothetical protein
LEGEKGSGDRGSSRADTVGNGCPPVNDGEAVDGAIS